MQTFLKLASCINFLLKPILGAEVETFASKPDIDWLYCLDQTTNLSLKQCSFFVQVLPKHLTADFVMLATEFIHHTLPVGEELVIHQQYQRVDDCCNQQSFPTLDQHERRHFPAVSPAYHDSQAHPARR
jgi:hypothetical protein